MKWGSRVKSFVVHDLCLNSGLLYLPIKGSQLKAKIMVSWWCFSTSIVTWITGLKMSGFIIWLNDFLCCLFCKNNDVPLSAMSLSTINNQYKSTNWYSDSWITFVGLVSMNLSPGRLFILLNWKMFLTGFQIIPCRHLCSLKPK